LWDLFAPVAKSIISILVEYINKNIMQYNKYIIIIVKYNH